MKLSDEVMKSFLKTNKQVMKNKSALKIIHYFICKNISFIFDVDTIDPNCFLDLEKEIVKDNIRLVVQYFDKTYRIFSEGERILFQNANGMELASIQFSDLAEIKNTQIAIKEENTYVQVQTVNKKEQQESYNCIYECQSKDGSFFERAGYRLKPIGVKANENEFFELTSMYENVPKSFLERVVSLTKKKNIQTIHTSYEMSDLLDYLPEIYSILEEKCLEEVSTRKNR